MSSVPAVLVALAAAVLAASACTTYKAPGRDDNAGGGSMYRAVNSAGAY